MFPTCVVLEERQKEAIKLWVKQLGQPGVETEEDATPTSNITFEIYATGLGDVVQVWFKQDCCLGVSIGDDNEMYIKYYMRSWLKRGLYECSLVDHLRCIEIEVLSKKSLI